MKLLVLGGTQFLGRHVTEAALKDGHEVTLFNRGRTNPHLFPTAHLIKGDRNQDMEILASRGTWDMVVDCCGYFPSSLEKSTQALKKKVKKYVFISSVSVYSDFNVDLIDENSPCAIPFGVPDLNKDEGHTYGFRKKACEEIVLENFGADGLIIRPGLIVGPYDPTWRFPYWVERVLAGGEILAPGRREDPVQFVDARDLASWIVKSGHSVNGVFNTVGPDYKLSFEKYLHACMEALKKKSPLTWVDGEFLIQHDVKPWMELPLWINTESRGILRVDDQKVRREGFVSRPVHETILATAEWISGEKAKNSGAFGISAEREKELLGKWRAKA